MVPKLHPKGKSFKGAADYLLHDKGGKTTKERVAWTETLNLATRNPDAAWRVMAATAKDQERLKKEAGVKSTGRKSKDCVLHLTLSWHPTEEPSREAMHAAALGALQALGAADRQCMLVSHNDEPHSHVHLLINRVSAEDGRMLSSSNEKLALSKWAEQYEKAQGKIVCPERVRNNERRDGRAFTRAKRERSRPELEEGRSRATTTFRVVQKKKDAELAKVTREMHARHKAEWEALDAQSRRESGLLRAKVRELLPRYRLRVEKTYIDWRSLHEAKQRKELVAFCREEKTVIGRMVHRLQSIDFPALLANQRGERQTLRDAFHGFVSSDARVKAFKEKQRLETRELEQRREKALVRCDWKIFAGWRVRKVKVRSSYEEERAALWKRQQEEKAASKAIWRTRRSEREEVFRQFDPSRVNAARPNEREQSEDWERERERRR